jgi:hypothetical protein
MHIVIRAAAQPHAAARRFKLTSVAPATPTSTILQNGRDKPLWNITLLFVMGAEQCASAAKHLQDARVRLRDKCAQDLNSILLNLK